MRSTARRRLATTVVVPLAALVLGACSSGTDESASPMTTTAAAETGTASEPVSDSTADSMSDQASASRDDDVMFAQMMIPHHEQAIEMADLALDRAGSAEVRELALEIKAAQDPEIETMRGWLEEWGAPHTAPSDMGHDGGMMSHSDMAELEGAEGSEFDAMWLVMMIRHHDGAVEMAEDVRSTTEDERVRTMADEIIAAQQAEIDTMRTLLGSP
jgi:uncharacterized protein (DUF305 family)